MTDPDPDVHVHAPDGPHIAITDKYVPDGTWMNPTRYFQLATYRCKTCGSLYIVRVMEGEK